jgi:hypothetical protein
MKIKVGEKSDTGPEAGALPRGDCIVSTEASGDALSQRICACKPHGCWTSAGGCAPRASRSAGHRQRPLD